MSQMIIIAVIVVCFCISISGGVGVYFLNQPAATTTKKPTTTSGTTGSPTGTTGSPTGTTGSPTGTTGSPTGTTGSPTGTTASASGTTTPTPRQPGCYINLSDCANATNKPEYISTVGPLGTLSPASQWGYGTFGAHLSDQRCKEYMDTVNTWCENPATVTKSYTYVPIPSPRVALNDTQAACYKARYSKLTGTIPAVKDYWLNDGGAIADYPYCRS